MVKEGLNAENIAILEMISEEAIDSEAGRKIEIKKSVRSRLCTCLYEHRNHN